MRDFSGLFGDTFRGLDLYGFVGGVLGELQDLCGDVWMPGADLFSFDQRTVHLFGSVSPRALGGQKSTPQDGLRLPNVKGELF